MMMMMMMMMVVQVVLAVESVERSRQLLASGELRDAFLVSRQASDASGLSVSINIVSHDGCRIERLSNQVNFRCVSEI